MMFEWNKNMQSRERIELTIGDVKVGDGHPCFIVAEIGSNHNNDFDFARALIDAAAMSGVNAVKFQTFRAANHYSHNTPSFSYLNNVDTYSLIETLEFNRSWTRPLKQHAEEQGILFFSSPCDHEAIVELDDLDVPAFKIASFDLPDLELISLMAKTGKPIILSTGMANQLEIGRAVSACRDLGNDKIILLQCTSLYPAPPNLSNLNAMSTMRAEHGTLVGYSDHTHGDHIGISAVTLGAALIEKHFTLDRTLPGPDHSIAIHPDELSVMISKIRNVEEALGDGIKDGPREEEYEMYKKGRRSLHARTDIKAGETITVEMLTVKRPGLGISPHHKYSIVGKTARTNITADQWITWDMI